MDLSLLNFRLLILDFLSRLLRLEQLIEQFNCSCYACSFSQLGSLSTIFMFFSYFIIEIISKNILHRGRERQTSLEPCCKCPSCLTMSNRKLVCSMLFVTAAHPSHGDFIINDIKIVLFIVTAFIIIMHFTLHVNYIIS